MPTREWLINNYPDTGSLLGWASTNHGVSVQLVYLKKLENKQVEVMCKLAADSNDTFSGSGATKHEALATCLSTRFPG